MILADTGWADAGYALVTALGFFLIFYGGDLIEAWSRRKNGGGS